MIKSGLKVWIIYYNKREDKRKNRELAQIKESNGNIEEAKKYFSPYYDGPLIVLINRMSLQRE